MEEYVCNVVLLAALEYSLYAILCIIFLFILSANACRRRIEHNVYLFAKLLEAARYRNACCVECGFICSVYKIQIVFNSVCSYHVLLVKRLKRKCRRKICYSDELHITLLSNAVRKTLTYRTVSRNTYFNFTHLFSSCLNATNYVTHCKSFSLSYL